MSTAPPILHNTFIGYTQPEEVPMDQITEQFKKGYKTSEFWTTVLTPVATYVAMLTSYDADVAGLAAALSATATSVTYIFQRGFLKKARVRSLGDATLAG